MRRRIVASAGIHQTKRIDFKSRGIRGARPTRMARTIGHPRRGMERGWAV
jgi:hypothetical protein